MDLIKTSIKRPVAIIMAMFIVLILGATSITKMKMALTPDMDMPMVIVMTTYEDAGPEEVESLVTEVIEGAIANVENVDGISSTSSEGSSMVMVSFNYGIDLDSAVNSINEKINMVEGMLPDDAGSPTVLKMDMNSMPIAYITITSESVSTNELKTMIEDYIQPRIERQVGVSSVDLTGGKEYEITILVEPERLEGLGLDISTIGQVLASENSNQAGGSVEYGEKQLTISTKLKMASIEEIEKTPIRLTNGTVMQLSEIATIQETEKEVTSISRYNGQECITLSVTMASDGNTVNTVKAVQAEVEKLSADYPNLAVEVTSESGSSIESSILTVVQNIIIGAILSIIILFVFLKNVGLTGIIAISMPLSIVGTFVLLYFSNTTLNLVSLGGLSIGVGMLVDNSVVVLENIYRYRTTEGYNKIKGTYKATKEVGPSIIASTLTTIVVFVPFIFTAGMVTEMMKDLALAIVFSLAMSLVVAITVVPMISGTYVNNIHRNKAPKILGFINVLLSGFDFGLKLINKGYAKLLGWAVRYKKTTLALIVAIFCASLTLIPSIGLELMPSSDEGTINITVKTPTGSKLEKVNELSLKVEKIIEAMPEVSTIAVSMSSGSSESGDPDEMAGSSSAQSSIIVTLVNKNSRTKSTAEMTEEIRLATKDIAGASITVSSASSMGSMGSGGVSVQISGDSLDTLKTISDEIMRQMGSIEGTRQITSSFADGKSQISINLNKEKIRQYGMTGSQVGAQIRSIISGYTATTLKVDGAEYKIRVVYPEKSTTSLSNLGDISINTGNGVYLPLSSLAEISLDETPTSISRNNQQRYVTVSCNVYGAASGTVGNKIQSVINQMSFPDGYSVKLGGSNEMMNETFSSLLTVIILAVVLVYMVMAAQFESFINPFIIMFTIPLAFTGAILLLYLGNESISMMSLIGCLVLVGIVVNNGIVLIDYINTLREHDGLELTDAVLTACPTRLRPILMTALTTILGQLPLIFSNGTNSEMLRGMGLVIAGGLATSTVLTLLLVPILYMYFDRVSSKFKKLLKIKPKKNRYEIEAECSEL